MTKKATAQPCRHLDRRTLDEYCLGEASVLDLLACGVRHVERSGADATPGTAEAALLSAVEAALEESAGQVEHERDELPGLIHALEGATPPVALVLVAREARFHTLWFVESLVSAGRVALGHRNLRSAGRLTELAQVAVRGIDPVRYGGALLGEAKGELTALSAAVALAEGDLEQVEALLTELRRSLRSGTASDEVRGGATLVRAGLFVAREEWTEARAALEAASMVCTFSGVGTWEPWAEAGAAWLDRRSGHSEAAVERLHGYFGMRRRWGMETPIEWWPARELVLSLLSLGREAEAADYVRQWAEARSSEGSGAAELKYLSALLAREDGGAALEGAYRTYLALEMGLSALDVALDLYQASQATAAAGGELGRRLEEVALLGDVPRGLVAETARVAYGLSCGDRGTLAALRDMLTQARAGWGPASRHDEP